MRQLCNAVGIRHDIVHRNGHAPISKKKSGHCEISEEDILKLIKLVNEIISDINKQIKDNDYKS